MTKNDLYFALDCEMVGTGPDGFDSAVARVTLINWEHQVVLDTFVKVPVPVTDYRTHVSGIRPEDIESEKALTFDEARAAVETILRGKILIGHGLENDLCALGLTHPWCDVRDTARYGPYMREVVDEDDKVVLKPRKLRDLAWELLQRQIQCEGKPHCPMEDAGAALDIYKSARLEWEEQLSRVQQLELERKGGEVSLHAQLESFGVTYEPQVVYQRPIAYSGPYGPHIPGFSPAPEPFSAVLDNKQSPSSSSSRRWFSRPKSPDRTRSPFRREEANEEAEQSRPLSPRSSGRFSFRRASGPKSTSGDTLETSTTTTTWDYTSSSRADTWSLPQASGSWNSDQTLATGVESPVLEEQVHVEEPPKQSRLATYLASQQQQDDDEEALEVFPEATATAISYFGSGQLPYPTSYIHLKGAIPVTYQQSFGS
jgi:RNA exonuclease 4